MKQLLPFACAFAILLTGCSGRGSDITVVSKALKSDLNTSTMGGTDPGMSVPSSGSLYWVEGKAINNGTEEARNVTIAFRVTDGATMAVLTAEVPLILPGKTAGFRTPVHTSPVALRLVEEDPAIRTER